MTAIWGPITLHYSAPNQQAYIVSIVRLKRTSSRLHSASIPLLFTDRNIRGGVGFSDRTNGMQKLKRQPGTDSDLPAALSPV